MLGSEKNSRRRAIWTRKTSVFLYFSNDSYKKRVDFLAKSFQRIMIVSVATVRCFFEYRSTLDTKYESDKERNNALERCHQKCAEITLHALENNGGIYIKLGQHISALTYLLPKEWTSTMTPLQDRCPKTLVSDINEMFIEDIGCSLDDMFSEFDEKPIGVASLAQVHVATLRETGEKVAVKCQHPSLKEFVPLDILITKNVFELLYKVFPEYDLNWLGEEMQSSIYVELNFVEEAKNARNTSDYFKNYQRQTALRVPKIYSAQPRVLIMEYVGGSRLDNLEYFKDNNISRAEVSACLAHIFNNMIFTPGVGIHCDPHGGNLAIRAIPKRKNGHNFEIILYDHGLYRFVPIQLRRAYARFWLAIIDSDEKSMRKYAKEFAGVTDEEFPLFAAAMTGRDFEHAVGNITTPRSQEEINYMVGLFEEGSFLTDVMALLSKLPKIALLIIKTNDLVRVLDENMEYPLGPVKSFLIMASYCARTIYEEDREVLLRKVWWTYKTRSHQLLVYNLVSLFSSSS
ncbi:Cqd2p [Ascoidea rubescens DSM 1968]|uniref:ABC1-domain-containing protein n=1 Tax=Ascoidea rubescens DSM 1968 TaxID=1344418 RepID=A0A1D2VMT0_9ASCO|nr:ABC1-domain-containing protein [Ascoidea rubescens DSM 1968]ODV62855.1 ABC1-domain-containing protein [Ascoidea rubescens DSM 1968]